MNTRTSDAPKTAAPREARSALTNEMAAKYMPRVQAHAARVARKLPGHIAVGDLVSAGFVGLIDAFSRYDTSRMESFEAYVDHRVRGAIFDELRKHDPLTRDQRAFVRQLSGARHALCNRLGRTPHETEIAAELGLSLAQFRAHQDRVMATSARTAASVYNDEDTSAQPANDCPEQNVAVREERSIMSAAVGRLSARHRDVLRLYYDEGRTLREIGRILGVTESRVSQIHSEAVVRLRASLASSPLDASHES